MDASSATSEDAFRAFEHAGWEAVSRQYVESFAALTGQSIELLLDATGVRAGWRVLDVATGPGYAAAAAARRGAHVVALDFAAAMVDEAQRKHPTLDFREGVAEELPFARSGACRRPRSCSRSCCTARCKPRRCPAHKRPVRWMRFATNRATPLEHFATAMPSNWRCLR